MRGMKFEYYPTKPGDLVFFDCYAPHASEANMSDKIRRLYFATYNRLLKAITLSVITSTNTRASRPTSIRSQARNTFSACDARSCVRACKACRQVIASSRTPPARCRVSGNLTGKAHIQPRSRAMSRKTRLRINVLWVCSLVSSQKPQLTHLLPFECGPARRAQGERAPHGSGECTRHRSRSVLRPSSGQASLIACPELLERNGLAKYEWRIAGSPAVSSQPCSLMTISYRANRVWIIQ